MACTDVELEIGKNLFTFTVEGDIETWHYEGTWRDGPTQYSVESLEVYHAHNGAPVSPVFLRFLTREQWEHIEESLIDSEIGW